jgi:Na+/proline symporter
MAIVMSSLDSLLNAGAVCVARDVAGTLVALSDRASLVVGRAATVGIALAAATAAILSETEVPGIIDGLLVCYNLWAPAMLPAIVLALCIRRARPAAGILSIVAGAGAAATMELAPFKARLAGTGVPPIGVALALSLVAYAVGHWLVPYGGKDRA